MTIPFVSICVPNLNKGRFIRECLNSIRSQTYQNWECIVCDSNSNDDSEEIIQEFCKADSRFLFFSVPKEGIYAGWNECIERAKGDYIYIATSDDVYYPDCIKKSVQFMTSNQDVDMLHFPINLINADGDPIAGIYEKTPGVAYYGKLNQVPHYRNGDNEQERLLLLGSLYLSITSVFFRASEAIKFPTNYEELGDYFFFLDYLPGRTVGCLPEPLATWRIHEQQATSSEFSRVRRLSSFLRKWISSKNSERLSTWSRFGMSWQVRRAVCRKCFGNHLGTKVNFLLTPKVWRFLIKERDFSPIVHYARENIPTEDIVVII